MSYVLSGLVYAWFTALCFLGGMGGIAIKVKLHGMIKKGYWRSAAVYVFVGSEPMTVYGYTLPCSL